MRETLFLGHFSTACPRDAQPGTFVQGSPWAPSRRGVTPSPFVPPNHPIPSPEPAAAAQRNTVSTRLRGSHISFNSNIRVLNIHREIGIGWHLQCFQIHSFQVQRQIKNHSGRKQFSPAWAPPRHPTIAPARTAAAPGATATPKGDGHIHRPRRRAPGWPLPGRHVRAAAARASHTAVPEVSPCRIFPGK